MIYAHLTAWGRKGRKKNGIRKKNEKVIKSNMYKQ